MVNLTLPFTTNEMISISTSHIFRSWVVISHLRRPMSFLSLNLYETPWFTSGMNVLLRKSDDFPVSYSHGHVAERLKSSFRTFYCQYADLIWQYEVSLSQMLNVAIVVKSKVLVEFLCCHVAFWIYCRCRDFCHRTESDIFLFLMTFWPLTSYSDVPTDPTFHQFHDLYIELDLHREWFSWSICNGFCMPAENTYPFGQLVPSVLGTYLCSNCKEKFSRSCRDFSRSFTFNTPRYCFVFGPHA